MTILFVIALIALFVGLVLIIFPNWENTKMKIVAGFCIAISYMVLIASGAIMKSENNELQSEVETLEEDSASMTESMKEPELSDLNTGKAEKDTIIFIRGCEKDTLTILVWK